MVKNRLLLLKAGLNFVPAKSALFKKKIGSSGLIQSLAWFKQYDKYITIQEYHGTCIAYIINHLLLE